MKSFSTVAVALLGSYYLAENAYAQGPAPAIAPITTPTTPVTSGAPTPAPTTPVGVPPTPAGATPAIPPVAPTVGPTAAVPAIPPMPTITPPPTIPPVPMSPPVPGVVPPPSPPVPPPVTPGVPPSPPVPPPVTPGVPPPPVTPAPAPAPPPLPGAMPIEGTPWTEENPMPYALYEVGCGLYDGKIWIFGNSDTEDGTAATVVFDPTTGTYDYEQPPRNRPGGGPFVTAAKGPAGTDALWVIGGFTAGGNSGLGASVQYFGPDPNNPTNPPPYFWNTNIAAGPKNVGLAAAGLINDNAHICGGWDDIAKGTAMECTVFSFANAFGESPWSNGSALVTGVHKACYGTDGTALYIAGGRTKNIGKYDVNSITETVQIYVPGKATTVGAANIPEPRSGYISAFNDGQLICMGGEIDANFTDASVAEAKGVDPTTKTYMRVDIYDTASESWSEGTDLPVGLQSGCAVVNDGTVYVIGGRTKSGGDPNTGSDKIYSIAVDDLLSGATFSPGPTPAPPPIVDLVTPSPGPTEELAAGPVEPTTEEPTTEEPATEEPTTEEPTTEEPAMESPGPGPSEAGRDIGAGLNEIAPPPEGPVSSPILGPVVEPEVSAEEPVMEPGTEEAAVAPVLAPEEGLEETPTGSKTESGPSSSEAPGPASEPDSSVAGVSLASAAVAVLVAAALA